MIWPKTVGKSIEDYLEEARPELNRGEFGRKIGAYLTAQGTAEAVRPETIDALFGITLQFLTERLALSSMKEAQIERDWDMRKTLIASLRRHVVTVRSGAQRRRKMLRRPLTCLLADSVFRKTNSLLEELDRVAQFQTLQVFMFGALRKSTNTSVYQLELNKHLKGKFPAMKQKARDLIIAGTLIASGLKVDDPYYEHATNVPMARSRGKHAAEDDESYSFLEWAREPVPQRKPKGRQHP